MSEQLVLAPVMVHVRLVSAAAARAVKVTVLAPPGATPRSQNSLPKLPARTALDRVTSVALGRAAGALRYTVPPPSAPAPFPVT